VTKQSLFAGKDGFAALLRNKMPILYHTPWIPACAGMTNTTRPSFRASTARPGIQESPVSASTLSALRYGQLAMTLSL